MRETLETIMMEVEELEELAQEQLLNQGFKLDDKVMVTSYVDEYLDTVCIIIPINK